ncbi:MAG TPA: hypothetical protein VIL60_09205 [Rhodanobacter sp.]
MDFLYSSSLLISLGAGGIGLAIGAIAAFKCSVGVPLLRAGLFASSIAAVALTASVAVHWHWGHGNGSAEPMGLAQFSDAHPAFLVAVSIIVPGLLLLFRARRRRLLP